MKKKGYIFWVTGLSGSGKSTVGRYLLPKIKKKYGTTILVHGDNIRKIYNIKNFDRNSRFKLGKSNFDLCKFVALQGVNVIFTTVGLIHKLHSYNRKNYQNYIEIFIKANINQLIKKKSKFFYKKKIKNVMGIDIKSEFPKKPDVKVINNFSKLPKNLAEQIFKKIENHLKNDFI